MSPRTSSARRSRSRRRSCTWRKRCSTTSSPSKTPDDDADHTCRQPAAARRRSSTSCSRRTTAARSTTPSSSASWARRSPTGSRRQVEAGIDLVSDGEMSKIGYATYVRYRLSGFELGEVPRATPADLDAYPRLRDRLAQAGAGPRYKRPSVAARSPTSTGSRSRRDLARSDAAVDGATPWRARS